MTRKLIIIGLIALTVNGFYFFAKKFMRDRERAMNYVPVVHRQMQLPSGPQTTTRTYTQKDIEEARKKGKPLPGMNQPYVPPNAAGDAAVQRSLKTLEEINRINEMNRRLNEQQQRNQK